ncbi:MAG: DUF4388 domain-containing protein [Gemmatimonadaceae bacterium]|jgi:Flp pilus assembly protein TadD|nr:DUF4388 domain-containing protein [Gemmatimonadaceae bacterium]
MPLEGALRDLGLAEVLQLLASGQRTGMLRVAGGAGSRVALLRFQQGAVVMGRWEDEPDALLAACLAGGLCHEEDVVRAADWALAQQPPRHVVEGLVETGAIGIRTRDLVARRLVEDLCFEITTLDDGSWQFSDDEAMLAREPRTGVRIAGEALVLDAARRRDEWPAIAAVVGSLATVPVLADPGDTTPLAEPAEAWQLLSAVDGTRTVRQVAAASGVLVFDAARWVARWMELGVLAAAATHRRAGDDPAPAMRDALLAQAMRALADGNAEAALGAARTALMRDHDHAPAHLTVARALRALGRDAEGEGHVRRALQLAPDHPDTQLELGYAAARRGDHAEADAAWARYLAADPTAPDAGRVRAAREAVAQLHDLLSIHAGA